MATTAKVDTDDLRRFKDVNLDEAPSRRHVRDSLKDTQLNLDHILFKVKKKNRIWFRLKSIAGPTNQPNSFSFCLNSFVCFFIKSFDFSLYCRHQEMELRQRR